MQSSLAVLNIEEESKKQQPNLKMGTFTASRIFCFYHSFLIFLGVKREISESQQGQTQVKGNSFPDISEHFDSEEMADKFMNYLDSKENPDRMDVFLGLILLVPYRTVFCLFACVFQLALIVAGSICVNVALTSASKGLLNDSFLFLGLFCISQLLSLIIRHNGWDKSFKVVCTYRAAVMLSLYRVSLGFTQRQTKVNNIGKLINLISNDLATIQIKTYFLFTAVVMPINLIITSIAYYYIIGWWGLLLTGSNLVNMAEAVFIGTKVGKTWGEINAFKDLRTKKISEMIEGIRIVKLYGWERPFGKAIQQIREKEVEQMQYLYFLQIFQKTFSNVQPIFACFFTFLANFYTNGSIDITQIYPTLQIATGTKVQLIYFSTTGIQHFFQQAVMAKRFLDVYSLSRKEKKEVKFNTKVMPENILEFQKYSASWNSQSKEQPTLGENSDLCLRDVNFSLIRNHFASVVGKIGSGKSSLLYAILGQINDSQGRVSLADGIKISYVEQDPFIFSGTIRDNIVFDREFDEGLLRKVCEVSELSADLSVLPGGDKTEIGQKGINLSGGQKARLSLARALYAKADLNLLDDPLSALDSKVSRKVYSGLREFLKQKSTLLVTNQVHLVEDSDLMVLMDKGTVLKTGNPQSLRDVAQSAETKESELNSGDAFKLISDENAENVQSGLTGLMRYLSFVKAWWYLPVLSVVCEMAHVSIYLAHMQVYQSFKLPQQDKKELFLTIGLLIGFYAIFYFLGNLFIYLTALTTNSEMHRRMVDSVLHGPIRYFDVTPLGRILNRFTSDIGILDVALPMASIDTVEGPCLYVGVIISIAIFAAYTLIPVTGLTLLVFGVAYSCGTAINTSKKLELEHRSPIISWFTNSIGGILQIRIAGNVVQCCKRMAAKINQSSKFFMTYYVLSRGFGFVLSMISLLLNLVCVFVVQAMNPTNPSLVGISANYLIITGGYLQWFTRQILNFDSYIVSSARVINLIEMPQEEYQPKGPLLTDSSKGEGHSIWIQNYSFRYRDNLPLVLQDINLRVRRGQKIGVVGRTGSGKSSLINAIYLVAKPVSGQIFIDGKEFTTMPLEQLRSSMTIIPQTSFLFIGTVRQNLDPFEERTDQEIWKALAESGLKDYVQSLEGKLMTKIASSSDVFSAGQKQLLCLTRAALRKSDILLLDEATSNVDLSTDEQIQRALKTVFKHHTIITVAHRLNTIADYDRVIVMAGGKIVEQGSPFELLANSPGDSSITRDSEFSRMVGYTGHQNAQAIFQAAKSKRA